MARKSKFQKGQKVVSLLNKHTGYEVVEVKQNSVIVKVTDKGYTDLVFECPKRLLEVVEE